MNTPTSLSRQLIGCHPRRGLFDLAPQRVVPTRIVVEIGSPHAQVRPQPQIGRRHRTDPTRRLGRADERMQAEPAAGDLSRHSAVDLDRLAGAVEC